MMTDLEQSMHYERIYGHFASMHTKVQADYGNEKRTAEEEGREPDNSYEDVLRVISEQKAKYRQLSDMAFLRHKEKHPDVFDDEGFDNLIVGIIQRAALDYGTALSEKDLVAQANLERFAAGYGQELSNFDISGIFEQLKNGYKRFCAVVSAHPLEIIAYSKEIAGKHHDGERRFHYKYHCPVCKGPISTSSTGRQAKRKGTAFRCNHCNFVREVMLG